MQQAEPISERVGGLLQALTHANVAEHPEGLEWLSATHKPISGWDFLGTIDWPNETQTLIPGEIFNGGPSVIWFADLGDRDNPHDYLFVPLPIGDDDRYVEGMLVTTGGSLAHVVHDDGGDTYSYGFQRVVADTPMTAGRSYTLYASVVPDPSSTQKADIRSLSHTFAPRIPEQWLSEDVTAATAA